MSFENQIGSLVAGTTVNAVAYFTIPSSINTAGGVVAFDVIDSTGLIYVSGAASSTSLVAAGDNQILSGTCPIAIPSNIPASVAGTSYQVRYTLTIAGQSPIYTFEQFVVLPPHMDVIGAQDTVELFGGTVKLSIVLPTNIPFVGLTIYRDNTPLHVATPFASSSVLSEGYLYTYEVDSNLIIQSPQMVPFNVMWDYLEGTVTQRMSSKLFLVSPSIMQAAQDVKSVLSRTNLTIGGNPDIEWNIEDLMTFLRLGADYFNGYGSPTNFTMTNATGPVRAYWLAFSNVQALRSQYLAEGNKSFDFSGQSVTLSADRTAYYESAASAIESQVFEACKQFKIVLSKRGLTQGDGNINPLALNQGAIGSIGIALGPISNTGPRSNAGWYGNGRLF